MAKKNPKVDAYITRQTQWQAETKKLRSILLATGLGEEIKWGKPCYTHGDSNIAIIQSFKPHCALMFFKGALLNDPGKHLASQGPNSQSAMRLELTSTKQVSELAPVIRDFVEQAIRVEESGQKVTFKPATELRYPEELEKRLAGDRRLAAAFEALTPGRRRGYVMHFASAKQSSTRAARIDKCVDKILAGKGLQEA